MGYFQGFSMMLVAYGPSGQWILPVFALFVVFVFMLVIVIFRGRGR